MAAHGVTARDINALTGRDYPETERAGAALRGLLARLEAKLGAWWCYRTTVRELEDLSDRQLADIGLRRADLHVAYNTPFGVDPTERLGIIADARCAEALARQVR